MTTKKLYRGPLQADIIQAVNDYIREHALSSGDKLPSQSELVEYFGVSRTSIREALKTLEALGTITVVNGVGMFVNDVGGSMVTARVAEIRTADDFLEILEVRRMLEAEILKRVVKKASDEEIEEIARRLTKLVERDEEYRNDAHISVARRMVLTQEEDAAFHRAIHVACHNRFLADLTESLSTAFRTEWLKLLEMGHTHSDALPYHDALVSALKNRNVKAAIRAHEQIVDLIAEMASFVPDR